MRVWHTLLRSRAHTIPSNMLAKFLRPSLRCVAGLFSVFLVKSTLLPSSNVAMATGEAPASRGQTAAGRGRQNHFYQSHHHAFHHHPEYHGSEYRNGGDATSSSSSTTSGPWFEPMDDVLPSSSNPVQRNYGVAVTDVDNDGELEILVAGNSGPNLVLKYNHTTQQLENLAIDDPTSPYFNLRDPNGNAIGVAACDVDGDGREEIYVLNTNSYSGPKSYGDKLFKLVDGRYVDVLADPINQNVLEQYAGRSVACIDRQGTGRYSLYLSNYVDRYGRGPCAMVEMDVERSDVASGRIKMKNVAREVGVERKTGGRGVTVGPILNDEGRSDIFCDNEWGPNFLYQNNGQGSFTDVASTHRVADASQHGRGVALADFNEDGRLDIVYGNWNGDHRLFLQKMTDGRRYFEDVATEEFKEPSPIRTVIAADLDNDGILEVFFNNIAYHSVAPNRLYKVFPDGEGDVEIVEIGPERLGEALEPTGHGTGGAVTDFNNDGKLELVVSHGESASEPLTVFRSAHGAANRWMRVMPLTQHGAPARGALVKITTRDGRSLLRVIDGGSGYLCQMEPVAHFGFGETDSPVSIEIKWPDTRTMTRTLTSDDVNSFIRIAHPGDQAETADARSGADQTQSQSA